MILIGVNAEGCREILGVRIANSETEQAWLETFHWLKSLCVEGVDLMVSDAYEGLVDRSKGNPDRALETLADAIANLRLPAKCRRRPRTTSALERLIQEVRRREKVIRIFPSEACAHLLLGAHLVRTYEG